jgi:hypothetical protein
MVTPDKPVATGEPAPEGANYGELEEAAKPAPKPVFGRPLRRIRRAL